MNMTLRGLPPTLSAVPASLCLLAWLVLGLAGSAPAHAQSAASLACLIVPERVAELGNPIAGVVESVEVERGDTVKKGQVVARMRADVERASSSVARSRADSEADLRGAVAASDLAKLKLDRAKTLQQQNFISAQAVEQSESEYRVAYERVAQSREVLGTSAREVTMAQAQVSQRILRAPFDGVVIERYANPGERFELNPLLKIASIGQLRVEVVAPTALFGSLKPGQEVSVQPELPGAAARSARIAQIDRVLDPASNTFRLRLDLPNADASLPAGLRCKVDLGKPVSTPEAARAEDKPHGTSVAGTARGVWTQAEVQRPVR